MGEETNKTGIIATAFGKATSMYHNVMQSIHEINEYVTFKNDLDSRYAEGSFTQEEYDRQVQELQDQYFKDDESKKALADKAEAVKDWSDEHGVTDFVNKLTEKASSIKAAFISATGGEENQGEQTEQTASAEKNDTTVEQTSAKIDRAAMAQEMEESVTGSAEMEDSESSYERA